jgi:hypothetical protein
MISELHQYIYILLNLSDISGAEGQGSKQANSER